MLAFDTSTERMAIGLQAPAGPLHVDAAGGAAASTGLLPQIHALLARAGITLSDLDAIAYGRGPGAFTGLRTACAVAQGLGFGLARPLLPIDSLLVVAEDARLQVGPAAMLEVGVVMDARMDEVYAGRYRWQGGRWRVVQAPALFTLQALAVAWADADVPALLAGSALGAFGPRLGLPAAWPRAATEQDRAGALLRLAVAAAANDEGVDAASALPIYLRDRVALTTREREAGRAATAS